MTKATPEYLIAFLEYPVVNANNHIIKTVIITVPKSGCIKTNILTNNNIPIGYIYNCFQSRLSLNL